MTAGVPRNARLVDPATRQMAEDLARRSGLSLNEWVSRLMAEGPEDAVSQDYFAQAGGYLEPSRAAVPRHEPSRPSPDDGGRVNQAIERLSDRIQSGETRQALALAGVERSVREVIGRIDAAESEQMHAAARFEGAIEAIRDQGEALVPRLEVVEREQLHAGASLERALEAARAEGEVLAPRLEVVEREQLQLGARFESCVQVLKADGARLADRFDGLERGQAAADRRLDDVAAELTARNSAAVRVLGARVERVEREQLGAVAAFETALQEIRNDSAALAGRLDTTDLNQTEATGRLTDAVVEIRADTTSLGEQVRELAAQGPESAAKIAKLESALETCAGQIQDVERKTRAALNELAARIEHVSAAEQANLNAIRELKNACTGLDARLGLTELGAKEGLERAAADLSSRMGAAREALARELATAADARFERVDQTITKMSEQVAIAEKRSTSALERMGREVLEVAQSLNRRVQSVERQSTEVAGRAGAEISRMAGAVEDRLIRADAIQAAALEKLGGEIARITERLAERIASSERRSALAIDDVGEQVARVTDRINDRNERSTSELLDRIRQSEERTARLLEEARLKIDDRLSETQRRLVEQARLDAAAYDLAEADTFGGGAFPGLGHLPAEQPPAGPHAYEPDPADGPFGPVGPFMSISRPPAAQPSAAQPPAAPAPVAATETAPADETALDLDNFALEPNVGFDSDDEILVPAPAPSPGETVLAHEPDASFDPHQPSSPTAPPAPVTTTRELVERARAAARAASQGASAPRTRSSRTDDSILQGLSFQRGKAAGGMPGALMAAGALAVIGLSAGGYMFFEGKPTGKLPKRVADQLTTSGSVPAEGVAPSSPMAAVAVDPTPRLDPATSHALAAQYSAAVAKISSGEPGGLAQMQGLASRDYAPAQFYLAELYQDGKSGLARDAVLSRQWLEKAAEGGDRTAMHNLALDYHEGVGGQKNASMAAEWFRRAAELGLLDSQFNLAALYENGDGVAANPAEAYKWYLIAARSGDAEARAGALRVRALISPDARLVAERAAQAFTPERPPASLIAARSTAPPRAPAAASADIITAQRALTQLGYYQGPTDGSASPALHLAIAAYQRDQDLPVTGAPDAATVGKLAPYTK